MITLTVLIKQTAPNTLAMSFEPVVEDASDLEKLAAEIFSRDIAATHEVIKETGAESFDLEGDPARRYQHKIFGK